MIIKQAMLFPFWFGYARHEHGRIFAMSCYPCRYQLRLALVGALPLLSVGKLKPH